QKRTLALLGTLAVTGLLLDWRLTVGFCVAVANAVFLAAVSFKLVTCLVGLVRGPRAAYSQAARDDRRLPAYTVLVPVYREANVIGSLMRNLGAIDYPAEKLEILVLLESGDV